MKSIKSNQTILRRLVNCFFLCALSFLGSFSAYGTPTFYFSTNSYTATEGGAIVVTLYRGPITSWEDEAIITLVTNGHAYPIESGMLWLGEWFNTPWNYYQTPTIQDDAAYTTFTINFPEDSTLSPDTTAEIRVSNGLMNTNFVQVATIRRMDNESTVDVTISQGGNLYANDTKYEGGTAGENQVTIRFSRNAIMPHSRQVKFNVTGTASNGSDYTSLVSPLVIPADATYVETNITVAADSLYEGTESLSVTLTSGNYQIHGTNNSINVTIADDYPIVHVVPTNSTTIEGQTVSAFRVYRETYNANSAAKTVNLQYSGTAANGTDFTPALGSSVIIPAGEASVTKVVTPVTDSTLEGTETLTWTLQAGVYTIGSGSNATIGILDDAPTVTLMASDGYASESGGNTGRFTIERTGGTNSSLVVNYAVSGTAVAGSDYAALPASVTLAAGQLSTNLIVTALTGGGIEGAETIVLTLSSSSTYYLGGYRYGVVTIYADEQPGTLPPPVDRYWRGTGDDPTYWSFVAPLDFQKGIWFDKLNGNVATLFPGRTNWGITNYHFDATNTLSQASVANRIPFNNPIVAFGSRVGGTPLYLNHPYSFAAYAGNPLHYAEPIYIKAYYRSNHALVSAEALYPPNLADSNSWAAYVSNGFQITHKANGLKTVLSTSPDWSEGARWGIHGLEAYRLIHTGGAAATNFYYEISLTGYLDDATSHTVLRSGGARTNSLLYTLEFEPRPIFRPVFIDQPHFARVPMPPSYDGKSLAELMTNYSVVTNAITLAPNAATNLNHSPELRRHPTLDQFVTDMRRDPLALVNFVLNDIELTDAIDYSDGGNIAEESINTGGVSRGALGVFLEKQGSPVEQCALLVYLLRQAGVPAAYVFPPRNGMKMLDARLSKMLRFQVNGAFDAAGQPYTTNTVLAVNYPWVAAYIGTNWVHLFPWLKDTEIVEGLDLYDFMPTNYPNAYNWVRDYVRGNSSLLSLATDIDSTPRVIFPKFLAQTLATNHPGVSVDDLGVRIVNRHSYHARWQDFPTPTWVTNANTITVESLGSDSITNVSPALTNIFDIVRVEILSSASPNRIIQTGPLRLADLHNRRFYVRQTTNTLNQIDLRLILAPFSSNITGQAAFDASDPDLLKRQVAPLTLDQFDDHLIVRLIYRQNRALASSYAIDPNQSFFDVKAIRDLVYEQPVRKGDLFAICLNYGRVTRDMLNVHAAELWNMENSLRIDPTLTNSISTDVYQGATLYLNGMAYFEKFSQFDAFNRNLHKIHHLSSWAAGLSKISARRDVDGHLADGIVDPVLPGVDMIHYHAASVGNGTVRPDSGRNTRQEFQNYALMMITDGSAQEHQVINRFYQQTNAISTVRLLQMAQAKTNGGGPPIVELTHHNYAAQGEVVYQGKKLKNHDPVMWQEVSGILAADGYAMAMMTPGPMTNSAYKGMGALVLGSTQWAALISPGRLNGGSGENFANYTVSRDNLIDWSTGGGGAGDFSINWNLFDDPGQLFKPDLVSAYNYADSYDHILNEDYHFDPVDKAWAVIANNLFNLGSEATFVETYANSFKTSEERGLLDRLSDMGAQAGSKIADPVHAVTGEFFVDATDLALPGPMPLAVRRSYSSQNLADNQFGFGWKFALMPFLSVAEGGTNIYAAEMDGAVICYERTATNVNVWLPALRTNPQLNNNSEAGIGSAANRLRSRIVKTVDGATVYRTHYAADGSIRTFKTMTFDNGVLNRTRPYLTKWQDHRGNCFTFEFGTDPSQPDFGEVRRIQASNGNYLGFYYDIYGHVIEAYTGDNRRVRYVYSEFGDLETVVLPDNSSVTYEYQFRTQSVTNGQTVTSHPYSTHLLSKEIKPDGRVLVNEYDSQRRVTNQLATVGLDLIPIRNATFYYTNNFVLTNAITNTITGYTLIVDVFNKTTRYDYTNGLISKITDPLNQTEEQLWYADNATAPGYPRSLWKRKNKRGLWTEFLYDGAGNVVTQIVEGNLTGTGSVNERATNTTTYNANNLPLVLTDPATNKVEYVYSAVFPFLRERVIHHAGVTRISTNFLAYYNVTNTFVSGGITYTNFANGLLQREIRAYNSIPAATNEWAHDGRGFIIARTNYTGTADPNVVTTFFHNSRGELVEKSDAAGRRTRLAYDEMGRPRYREVFEAGQTVPLSWEYSYYNENGELTWRDGPRYNPEDYSWRDYDGAGRLLQEINWQSQAKSDGTGVEAKSGYDLFATTFQEHDGFGNLTKVIDPRGNYKTMGYDAIGQMIWEKFHDASGTALVTNQYAYESGGQLSIFTNALGGVTKKFYTHTGQLRRQENPDGSTNGWTYYVDGRPRREILGNGSYWEKTYHDALFTTTNIFYTSVGGPLTTNVTIQDRRGNVVRTIDALGNSFTNIVDGLDRIKQTLGPVISFEPPAGAPPFPGGNPPSIQQRTTNFFDAAGVVTSNANALGEKTITWRDALGRTTRTEIRNAANILVRESSIGYSRDHHGTTVTNGSGAGALISTSYTDNGGRTVLSIGYPAANVREFTRRVFDAVGNLTYETRSSATNTTLTSWTAASYTYDGLNRLHIKMDRDNAGTTNHYNALSSLTNRIMPGGSLKWQATYNNAGQKTKEYNLGTGNAGVRTNTYVYYPNGHAWAGLLQTKTDGRGVACTYTYDAFLRPATNTFTGTQNEHGITNVTRYDARGLVTSIQEGFTASGVGLSTEIRRSFDSYGQLSNERVLVGNAQHSNGSLARDAAGRRSGLGFGPLGYSYTSRADGQLESVSAGLEKANYTYTTAGLLASRSINSLTVNMTARDGVGRVLTRNSTVNAQTVLGETLTYTGDGLISTHAVVRPDFTDSRSYDYATASRRLTVERLKIDGTKGWTNVFEYDAGDTSGLGVLTKVSEPQSGGAAWSASLDGFDRIEKETNNVIRRLASGRVNATEQYASISVTLDGRTLPYYLITATNPPWKRQWQAMMELRPGPHTLTAVAKHTSGLFETNKTAVFTNNAIDQTTIGRFAEGQLNQRIWKNAAGQTNRIEELKWDGRGRLWFRSELDSNNNGYRWSAVYDGLGRRVQTTTILVTNGVALTDQPQIISQIYDPETEGLELAVQVDGRTIWKVYGPDLNGSYAGLNGKGGFEGIVDDLGLFHAAISDARGNLLAERNPSTGAVTWTAARPTAYGAVPEYRPVPLVRSGNFIASSAWGGRWPDISGDYCSKYRYYYPVGGYFLSFDPADDPANLNGYTYCGGDPVNFDDPDGRLSANMFLNKDDIKQSWILASGADYSTVRGWGEGVLGVVGGSAQVVDAAFNVLTVGGKSVVQNGIETLAKNAAEMFSEVMAKNGAETVTKNTVEFTAKKPLLLNAPKQPLLLPPARNVTRPPGSTHYSVVTEANLKPGTFTASDANHFRQSNRQLHQMMTDDPALAAKLETEYPGITAHVTPGPRGGVADTSPPGLTWHHNPEIPGNLQLVPRSQHRAPGPVQSNLHPLQQGGRETWGGGR